MTGVQTVQDIYDEATNHERTHVGLLGTDIYASHRTETYSATLSRPPVLLDPRQGDVGCNRAAPFEDALRSVLREFDTRPAPSPLETLYLAGILGGRHSN
jgi:hypothetical protein